MQLKKFTIIFLIFSLLETPAILLAQQESVKQPPSSLTANPFAEHFFTPTSQKLEHKISDVRGFQVFKNPSRAQQSEYAIVTDFGGGVIKSRSLSGLADIKTIDAYIKKNLKTANFEGVEIRQLPIPDLKGGATIFYWVGDKAFATAQAATAEVALMKAVVESKGGNFAALVRAAPVFVSPEPEQVVEIPKTAAQFKKEEELVLRFTDQMDIGERLYGPFQGVPAGEPIVWQSFGETTWRKTNLSSKNFNSQVGYWCNRIIFKGVRFPLNTLDPFVESTIDLDSTSNDAASKLMLYVGLEWMPLLRNVWLQNYKPFGDIPILDWIRNYKFYIKYGDRHNLKDEILNSKSYDLVWGVEIYYEWGVELPALAEGRPTKFSEFLRQYVWGEYYGNYAVHKTDFSSEKSFNALIANSSVKMGIKLPGIPLPHNPINDEIVLMPYLRFEHTNNSSFSFWYQNYFYIAPGICWMPFRCYRFKENEWLSKTKVFAEWIGIGRDQWMKQDGDPNPKPPDYDLRFGISFSSRRF